MKCGQVPNPVSRQSRHVILRPIALAEIFRDLKMAVLCLWLHHAVDVRRHFLFYLYFQPKAFVPIVY